MKAYKILEGGEGIPHLYWEGTHSVFDIIVIDLLGPSLDELIKIHRIHMKLHLTSKNKNKNNNCSSDKTVNHSGNGNGNGNENKNIYNKNIYNIYNNKFSLPTILAVAEQIISRIEYIHSLNLIHRDIKPDNFAIGIGQEEQKQTIFIFDFGLTKYYRNPKTKVHIPFIEYKKLTGTVRYASITSHQGIEQSRRDDLESAFYTIIYLLKWKLPWQGFKSSLGKSRYQKILERKQAISVEKLCSGLPYEFIEIYNYIRKLKFEEKPDYRFIKSQLTKVFLYHKCNINFKYDWEFTLKLNSNSKLKLKEDENLMNPPTNELFSDKFDKFNKFINLIFPSEKKLDLKSNHKIKPNHKTKPKPKPKQIIKVKPGTNKSKEDQEDLESLEPLEHLEHLDHRKDQINQECRNLNPNKSKKQGAKLQENEFPNSSFLLNHSNNESQNQISNISNLNNPSNLNNLNNIKNIKMKRNPIEFKYSNYNDLAKYNINKDKDFKNLEIPEILICAGDSESANPLFNFNLAGNHYYKRPYINSGDIRKYFLFVLNQKELKDLDQLEESEQLEQLEELEEHEEHEKHKEHEWHEWHEKCKHQISSENILSKDLEEKQEGILNYFYSKEKEKQIEIKMEIKKEKEKEIKKKTINNTPIPNQNNLIKEVPLFINGNSNHYNKYKSQPNKTKCEIIISIPINNNTPDKPVETRKDSTEKQNRKNQKQKHQKIN